ncbi:MAG: biotin--[acetyl-CoA-carboxylase] ligase [Gemmatimonadota bacterium]
MSGTAIIRLDELPSTMEAAHARAAQGAVHGTTVVAAQQLSARGTRGRFWSAGRGGLWLSMVARPSRTDALATLSLRVGLALASLLERTLPSLPAVGVKWPNDLMIDGRKVAGILSEARWFGNVCQWVVVGLGLNVANSLPDALAQDATRLVDWVPSTSLEALLPAVVGAMADATREAGPLTIGELNAFAARDFLTGRRVVEPITGTADGITPAGALRVRSDAGPVREVLGGVVTTPG